MKRSEFQTLANAKAHILKLENIIVKARGTPKPAFNAFDSNPIVDGEQSDPATLDEAKGVIADLRTENTKLKARIAELEKQLQEAQKTQGPEDPDEKDTFAKAGVTESSLAATIATGKDYREVWAAQRALDALQLSRVNSAVYRKARR
jgi:hypothetical protein